MPSAARKLHRNRAVFDAIAPNACASAASTKCPWRPSGRSDFSANSVARSLTTSSSLVFGTTSSTSRQSTARLPLTPSSVVQNTSAWSRRTLRLSVMRVSPPVPGSTAKQRQLRQRHGRGAVVGQDDVVGGQRQLVAAAGAGARDDADHALAGELAGVLDGVAGLVGELAEVDLVGMGRARQHADVGAGAEHPRLARTQQNQRALSGCSNRRRSRTSASSMSTPRS